MIRRPFLSRVALLVLDRGPSLLRLALEGDAPARRILASVGVTPHDLTAIADARAARRRAAEAPPADRVAPGADPLTMDDLSAALAEGQAARARFDAQTAGMRGASNEAQALPMRAVATAADNDGPVVLGPWKLYNDVYARARVNGLMVSKRADLAGYCIEVWRGGCALGYYAPTLITARAAADAEARKRGLVLLDAEPKSMSGQSVRRVVVWPGGIVVYCGASDTPTVAGCLLCGPDELYQPSALNGQGWYVSDVAGTRLAQGPQTGPEGERLLRAALHALGVEVLDG